MVDKAFKVFIIIKMLLLIKIEMLLLIKINMLLIIIIMLLLLIKMKMLLPLIPFILTIFRTHEITELHKKCSLVVTKRKQNYKSSHYG